MNTNKVIEIKSLEDFNKIISEQNRLFVIDFNADWCGPCQRIKPDFHKLAHNNPNVGFLSLNVDKVSEVSEHLEIEALPTFLFIINNRVVSKVIGSNINNVANELEKLNKVIIK